MTLAGWVGEIVGLRKSKICSRRAIVRLAPEYATPSLPHKCATFLRPPRSEYGCTPMNFLWTSIFSCKLVPAKSPLSRATLVHCKSMACVPSEAALHAALGVLTHRGSAHLSSRLLSTVKVPQQFALCLVLRPQNYSTEPADQVVNRTTFIADCPTNLERATGPLCSFTRWMQRAIYLFPNAKFIGKTDDDTVFHLERIQDSLAQVRTDYAVYGVVESAHWTLPATPIGFGPTGKQKPCDRTIMNGKYVLGPFNFPKGAFFLVSRQLVKLVFENQKILANSAEIVLMKGFSKAPWEDVWFGKALIHATPPTVNFYDIGWYGYSEQWGWYASPSSLIWHMKLKDPGRSLETYDYMDKHRSCTIRQWSEQSTFRLSGSCNATTIVKTFTPARTKEVGKACGIKENLKVMYIPTYREKFLKKTAARNASQGAAAPMSTKTMHHASSSSTVNASRKSEPRGTSARHKG